MSSLSSNGSCQWLKYRFRFGPLSVVVGTSIVKHFPYHFHVLVGNEVGKTLDHKLEVGKCILGHFYPPADAHRLLQWSVEIPVFYL